MRSYLLRCLLGLCELQRFDLLRDVGKGFCVLLSPIIDAISAALQGKELRFDLLGRDILKRPVCDAYLGETRIQDIPEEIDSSTWVVSDDGRRVERSSSPYKVSFREETGYSEGTTDFGANDFGKSANGVIDCSCFKAPTQAQWPRVYL